MGVFLLIIFVGIYAFAVGVVSRVYDGLDMFIGEEVLAAVFFIVTGPWAFGKHWIGKYLPKKDYPEKARCPECYRDVDVKEMLFG